MLVYHTQERLCDPSIDFVHKCSLSLSIVSGGLSSEQQVSRSTLYSRIMLACDLLLALIASNLRPRGRPLLAMRTLVRNLDILRGLGHAVRRSR
jgi:hypothetical protein